MRKLSLVVLPLFVLTAGDALAASTLEVGPGKTYAAPCLAFAAANDGDTIEIDAAGTYSGDVCAVTKNSLTIRGVNGRPKIDGAGGSFDQKAIWVIQGTNTTVDNVELTGAVSSESGNGAGIRQEGTNLTLTHSYLHDNQDGILTVDDANATVTIEYCEFSHNGTGDGQTHNLYINHVGELVFQFNYSHDAVVGHLLKSRALKNLVAYNHFTDGAGNASYEVSMPNAGTSYVIGNIIEQSDLTGSSTMIDYASEPANQNPTTDLYVVNNTLVSTRTNGALFVSVGATATTNATIINNIFNGTGTVSNQAGAVQTTNYSGANPMFVSATDFHLTEGSPCENAGTTPPNAADGMSLVPVFSYVAEESSIGRVVAGSAIDIGAYEIGGDVATPDGGAPMSTSSSSSSSTGGTSTTGPTTTADGGAAANNAAASSDSGCSCDTTRSTPSFSSAAGFVAIALFLRRRRRA